MRHNSKVRSLLSVATFCSILIFSGCGGNDDAGQPQSGQAQASSAASATDAADPATTTTETAEQPENVSDGQLDFFMERYISSQERLQRRQARIEQQLSSGGTGGTN